MDEQRLEPVGWRRWKEEARRSVAVVEIGPRGPKPAPTFSALGGRPLNHMNGCESLRRRSEGQWWWRRPVKPRDKAVGSGKKIRF